MCSGPVAIREANDALCRHCGYQLRDLPVESVCPECGMPISISLPERPGTIGDPLSLRDVSRIRRCLQLILISILFYSINRLAWYTYYVLVALYPEFATWMDNNTWLWSILYHCFHVDLLLVGAAILMTLRSTMRRNQLVLYAFGLGLVIFGIFDQWLILLYNRHVIFLGSVGPPWTPIRVLYALTPIHHFGLAYFFLTLGNRLYRSGFNRHLRWCNIVRFMTVVLFLGILNSEWITHTQRVLPNFLRWDALRVFELLSNFVDEPNQAASFSIFSPSMN